MNDVATARHWTEFLAKRIEVAGGDRLLQQFAAGTITRLCDCGCSSYDLKVSSEAGLEPLLATNGHRGGCVLSLAFHLTDRAGTVEFDVFVDSDGYLAGVDVACNSNSAPVPPDPHLMEPPFHVHGPLAQNQK